MIGLNMSTYVRFFTDLKMIGTIRSNKIDKNAYNQLGFHAHIRLRWLNTFLQRLFAFFQSLLYKFSSNEKNPCIISFICVNKNQVLLVRISIIFGHVVQHRPYLFGFRHEIIVILANTEF